MAYAAACVFFFGVAPAGGARTKKSNDSTALYNFEAQAGQVERFPTSLAAALKAEVWHLFGYTTKKRTAKDLDAVLMDTDGSDVAKKWAAILKKTFPASQTSVAKARQTSVAKAKVVEPVPAKKAESKPVLKFVMKPVISLEEIMERVKTQTNETIKTTFPTITPLVPFEDERPSLRRNPITAEVRALGQINELPSDGLKSLVATIPPLSKNRRTGASGMQILDRWTEKFKEDFPVSTPRGKTIFDGLIQELEKMNKDAPKRRSKPTTPGAFNEEKGTRTKFRVVGIDKKIAKKEQESRSKRGAAAKPEEERHLTRNDLEGEGVDKVSKTSNVRAPNSDKKRRNLQPISLAQLIARHVWSSILLVCAFATVGGFFSVWRTHKSQREEAVVKIQALYRGSKYRQNLFGEQNPLDYRLSTVNAGQ